ncbi:hypothetical protein [Jiulongibacter sp. NS-SX5]|uniref:hypothetical protein n=1 Tax=Jiulongibacter sp. NS-SX5 TaxID=3463854 RepID=UPI004059E289
MNKFIPLLSLVASACSYENQKKETVTERETVSIEELETIQISAIDSIYLESLESEIDSYQPLSSGEVLSLFNVLESPSTAVFHENMVEEYLEIDSIKAYGQYENYLNQLDIGMLRDALAIKIATLDDAKSLLWAVWYSSYEACPYFHGVDVYLSSIDKDRPTKTIKVGSNFSAIDPPSAIYNPIYSIFSADKIQSFYLEKEYDLDASQSNPVYVNADTLLATL